MTAHNQNSSHNSGLPQSTALMIRAAFAQVVKAIKGKPEPEAFWYDLTRADADLRNNHLDVAVLRCRQALEKAKSRARVCSLRRVTAWRSSSQR
jgi:hypothetical protein